MAIDIKCPHCEKPYKLKDDMAGKRVQCANQACRKPFAVEPPANGVPAAAPKPAAPKPAAVPAPKITDADELAAAALAAEERAAMPDLSVLHMTCAMCEHKWDVPREMQGKNVLCPDCKHRQKVPIPKDATKQDWRVRQGPQGARLQELGDVQASTNQNTVSGQTLLATGVVKIEYEPRPAAFYAKIAAGVLIPLVLIAGVYLFNSRTKKETADRVRFKTIIDESAEELKPLPVYRGLLRTAAADYEAKLNQPAGGKAEQTSRDRAVADIQQGLSDLKEANAGYDRDLLFGELASVALKLGGEGEDLKEKLKLSWMPPTSGPGTSRVRPSAAELEGVQGQIRRILQAAVEKGASFETRALIARRITREAFQLRAPAELVETFGQAAFAPNEMYEGEGQIGLECLRAGQPEAARRIAVRLTDTAGAAGGPPPVSLAALGRALDPPVAVKSEIAPASGAQPTEVSRVMTVTMKMAQNKPDEALNIARLPGPAADRVRALVVAADLSDTPAQFMAPALELASAAKSENATSPVTAYRLACAAARAGVETDQFLNLITDDTLRPWAKAEVLRLKLAADKNQSPDIAAADLPTEPKQFRGGHAWAAYQIARHTAAKTGDGKLVKQFAGWSKPFGYFGQAGAAVGLVEHGK